MTWEQYLPVKGRDGLEHPVCSIDVFDGEFGSHETECPCNGDPNGCKYNPTDWELDNKRKIIIS